MAKKSNKPCEIQRSWRHNMPISQGKLYAILAVIIILAVFVPQHQVKANFITEYVSNVANGLILNLLGDAISFFAKLLDSFIQYQTSGSNIYDLAFVKESWTTIRNFVNLFFILVLIIMAFGTIFSIRKYTWKEMLAPFLIAALFINFSLAIGQYVIGVSNGLAHIFLTEIQKPEVGGITANFQNGFSSVKIATSGSTSAGILATTTDGVAGLAGIFTSAIFSIIFLIGILLVFASVAIFTIVRLFILWFLLIISPIAWLGYALPNLRQKTWSVWWKNFLCWCFFLPYYLFFMMFAIGFIKRKPDIPLAPGSATIAGMVGNDFMFYALSLIFLIGGMIMAMKLACASGTGVKAVFGKIETGVRKYAPGAAYVRGGYAGLKERGAEILEKGAYGIGGAQKARIQEAEAKGFVAGIRGPRRVPGAKEEAYRAQATEVDKEIKKLQTLNLTLDQLNQKLKSGNAPEKLAALKLKAEKGWLDSTDLNEVNNAMRNAGGGRTALGASIISSLKKGKFNEIAQTTAQKEFIFDNLEDTEVKKAFGLGMAESREIMNETIAKKLLEIYSGDTKEVQDKVAAAVNKNIENFARDKSAREAIATRVITPTTSKAERKLIELTGKTMVEKKEVDSWKVRRSILQSTGGMDPATGDALTAEGRTMAKEIKDNNTLFKEEGDYRTGHGILPTVDLTPVQRTDVQRQIETNISSGLIQNLSTEEMKTPEIYNAIFSINAAGGMTAGLKQRMLGKKADRKRREAFDKAQVGPPIPY